MLSLLLALTPPVPAPPVPQDDAQFFEERVLPLLRRHCLECHGVGERLRGGLWLTRRAGLFEGGDSGPVVDLERPETSELLRMISYEDEFRRMPPNGKLAGADIATLTDWVRRGAPWSPAVEIEETATETPARITKGDGLEGWAYRPLERPTLPGPAGGAHPIDAFLTEALEPAGLRPNPTADRRTLIRRVTYGLTGLPPTPEEVDAFVNDERPEAWERLVERLLASPHYGERWGRHWLDVVRYAETNGFERDSNKPQIWRYRDWVIDAFNRDLPYDRFVMQQLAGDELDGASADALVATGFLRIMQWDDEPPQGRLQARYDVFDDIVRTTSEAFLGTTMGCARCHDHKGDPIDQEDYYSLVAFFEGLTDYKSDGWLVPILSAEETAAHAQALVDHEQRLDELAAEQVALEQEFARRLAERGEGALRRDLVDLDWRFYRDTWSKLPDFDMLLPEESGRLEGGLFDLSPATRGESFGFVFEGRLLVPDAGNYRFTLDCDDGARLTLDGAVVVEHDRTGPLGDPQSGVATLPAGSVPVRLDFFQWVGGAALDLTWAPAEAATWRYRFDEPAGEWTAAGYDDSGWSIGEAGFGTEGTPAAEVHTEWSTPDIWLRKAFQWDPTEGRDFVLAAHHDEDLEVWINGIPATRAGGFRVRYGVLELDAAARAALVAGTNNITVHCRNTGGGQYVHVALIPRAALAEGNLAELAFQRRQLSASRRPDARNDLAERIQRQGELVFGPQELKRYRAIATERRRLDGNPPRPPRMANVATERGPRPGPTHVHVRGNAAVRGPEVQPLFPRCVASEQPVLPEPAPDAPTSGRRRALAEWIAHADNPLTARVMVNRVWQHHFGHGIVPTPNDFGEFGERPSHPALLDWLAAEFIARGWSVKELQRLILSSQAYRMASTATPAGLEQDPTNTLLWRFPMRRLSAEELRDSVLAMTGMLNTALGGPSFYSLVPPEVLATASRPDAAWGDSPEEQLFRRSVYIKVKRSLLPPLLTGFDLADTDSSCPVRHSTTAPTQALTLLNSEFMHLRAADFAARVRREVPGDVRAQLRRALCLALGRAAQDAEVEELAAFHAELRSRHGLDEAAAMKQLCLLVLNLNEFVYLD